MKFIPVRYPWREIWVGIQLIQGSEKCVLIDTGLDDTVKDALLPALKENNIPLSAISLVINTHYHGDHALCNQELRQNTDARFAIHHAGAEALRHEQPFEPDLLLEDGMKIKEGDIELEIIHTPGHSQDSICVLETSTGTLFSGDSIQGRGIAELALPLWENTQVYCNSLKKLQKLHQAGRLNQIYPGHQFQPSSGTVPPEELGAFLQASLDAAEEYTAFAGKMKACNEQEFYEELVKTFHLNPSREWESATRIMANYFRQTARK